MRWLKFIPVFLLLLFIKVSVLGQGSPKIKFDNTNYDFGTIKEEIGKVTCRFEYTNVGTSDLTIILVRPQCGCQTVEYDKTKSVPPGQKGYIEVTYTTTSRPGSFYKYVNVYTNEPEMNVENAAPHKLYISGKVIAKGQEYNVTKAPTAAQNQGLSINTGTASRQSATQGQGTSESKGNAAGRSESYSTGGPMAPKVYTNSEKILIEGNLAGDLGLQKVYLEVVYHEERGVLYSWLLHSDGNTILSSGRKLTLSNGKWYTGRRKGFDAISINDCKSGRLEVSSVDVAVVNKGGYTNVFTYKVNKEIVNFKAWQADWNYKSSLKGALKEEIAYLKICPYYDHRADLENDIVNKKTKEIKDIIYVNDNYPSLKMRLADKMLSMVSSVSDCKSFLNYYGSDYSDYKNRAEEKLYSLLKDSKSQSDLGAYIEMFPNGKHTAEIKSKKAELQYYYKASDGGISDCATYISKYPNGRFVSEIKSRKSRLEQLQANSNKSLWKLGNKICHCNNSGVIMVTLDQWNEDKSNFKGIVIASPGGLYEGNLLQKGNLLWLEPKDWHKCLDDEVEYALNNDKSAEAEKLIKEKNMKFHRGTIVSQTFHSRGWLFSSTYTVTAKVEDWNDDYTKMKIQIVKTGGLERLDGESIYEGKYIWVSPIGWQ